jgi:hypothetical protein
METGTRGRVVGIQRPIRISHTCACVCSLCQEFDAFQQWFTDTGGRIAAVRTKAELWRRTTEQFQEAALAEQKEMQRRISFMDKRLQQHVAEWAELMTLLRAKYGGKKKK